MRTAVRLPVAGGAVEVAAAAASLVGVVRTDADTYVPAFHGRAGLLGIAAAALRPAIGAAMPAATGTGAITRTA